MSVVGESLIGYDIVRSAHSSTGETAAAPVVSVASIASEPTDMLGVVLSGSGTGDLFGTYTQAPASAQHYRRTRRGKHRRAADRAEPAATLSILTSLAPLAR